MRKSEQEKKNRKLIFGSKGQKRFLVLLPKMFALPSTKQNTVKIFTTIPPQALNQTAVHQTAGAATTNTLQFK